MCVCVSVCLMSEVHHLLLTLHLNESLALHILVELVAALQQSLELLATVSVRLPVRLALGYIQFLLHFHVLLT